MKTAIALISFAVGFIIGCIGVNNNQANRADRLELEVNRLQTKSSYRGHRIELAEAMMRELGQDNRHATLALLKERGSNAVLITENTRLTKQVGAMLDVLTEKGRVLQNCQRCQLISWSTTVSNVPLPYITYPASTPRQLVITNLNPIIWYSTSQTNQWITNTWLRRVQ